MSDPGEPDRALPSGGHARPASARDPQPREFVRRQGRGCLVALLILLGIPVFLWVWYIMAYPTYWFRYRLTMEVEVAGEVRIGTGVIEVMWNYFPDGLGSLSIQARGQAVAVDLGSHGMLLAQIAGGNPDFGGLGGEALDDLPTVAYGARGEDIGKHLGRRIELFPLGPMPAFAWLPNRDDPASARPIRATGLMEVISPEVRMRSVRIEITRDRVTMHLSTQLPWLAEYIRAIREHKPRAFRGVFRLSADNLSRGIDP